jgi:hypothetical protein
MLNTQNQKVVLVTPPAAILDNASAVTNSIDTLGFDYLNVYVALGATDIAVAALKLQSSDTDGSYADVTGANYATDGTLPSATDDNKVFAFHVDLLGQKRFFDLVATAGDGSTGTFVTAWAVLSRGKATPNSASERGLAQELFV